MKQLGLFEEKCCKTCRYMRGFASVTNGFRRCERSGELTYPQQPACEFYKRLNNEVPVELPETLEIPESDEFEGLFGYEGFWDRED